MSNFIEFTSTGDWSQTEAYLKMAVSRERIKEVLHKYGQLGVTALANATPSETGASAAAWYYEVTAGAEGMSIVWRNNHMAGGVPVVILLQYGHATGTGGFVPGRDFINRAIKPIFDQAEAELMKVVTQG